MWAVLSAFDIWQFDSVLAHFAFCFPVLKERIQAQDMLQMFSTPVSEEFMKKEEADSTVGQKTTQEPPVQADQVKTHDRDGKPEEKQPDAPTQADKGAETPKDKGGKKTVSKTDTKAKAAPKAKAKAGAQAKTQTAAKQGDKKGAKPAAKKTVKVSAKKDSKKAKAATTPVSDSQNGKDELWSNNCWDYVDEVSIFLHFPKCSVGNSMTIERKTEFVKLCLSLVNNNCIMLRKGHDW